LFMDKNNAGSSDTTARRRLSGDPHDECGIGKGVAIMANSDNGIAVVTFCCGTSRKNMAGITNRWQGAFPMLVLVAKAKGRRRRCSGTRNSKNRRSRSTWSKSARSTALVTRSCSPAGQDAITVFQRNVQEYPESGNVYDSLASIYESGRKSWRFKTMKSR